MENTISNIMNKVIGFINLWIVKLTLFFATPRLNKYVLKIEPFDRTKASKIWHLAYEISELNEAYKKRVAEGYENSKLMLKEMVDRIANIKDWESLLIENDPFVKKHSEIWTLEFDFIGLMYNYTGEYPDMYSIPWLWNLTGKYDILLDFDEYINEDFNIEKHHASTVEELTGFLMMHSEELEKIKLS